MKKNLIAKLVALAIAASAVVTYNHVIAQMAAPPITAKPISKEEAVKKYPPPAGKEYPAGIPPGEPGTRPGFFKSPYTGKVYDCRELRHGELILDEQAKKVFVRP